MVASCAAEKVGGVHDAPEAVDDGVDPDDDDEPDDDEDADEPAVPELDEPVAEVSFVTVIVY
jgi:hypothetical protein